MNSAVTNLSQTIASDNLPTGEEEQAVIPAGGEDRSRFDWQEVWYPVAYLKDLDRGSPTRFTLLGRDLAIWWDRHGEAWRVFEDRCPHRLVPLSEGRIADDGLLECPYHGWAFSGDGQCDRIPQQPDGNSAEQSNRACIAAFPAKEQQGMLFVYPGQPQNAAKVEIPTVDALEEDADDWVCIDTFRDLPYDALTLLENVLDSSHIPFTHHRSVGNRSNASPVDVEVLQSDRQGFQGFWEEGPRKGTLGSQRTRFIAPALMWHDLTSKQFGRTLTVVYATPIRKGECRIFARFPFKFSSKLPGIFIKLTPRWFSHIGQNRVLEDDQIFLHLQERALEQLGGNSEYAKACFLPTKADTLVLELRKWVDYFKADPFPNVPLPPEKTKEELLDRFHSHTQHCSDCRSALTGIRRIKLVAIVGMTVILIVSPVLVVLLGKAVTVEVIALSAIAALLGIAWLALGRLEQRFLIGRPIPARNLPDKKSK
ncbi:MAG: Rieske 2Fe-2S domain-containing protein [Synechococcus sp.]